MNGANDTDLFEALAQERNRQGLSLKDIVDRTQIPFAHLEALESGDFSVIPDGPYIEGYYRAYCRAVGVTPIQRVSAPQMIPAENRKKPIMPLWVVRMVAVTSIFLLMLFGAYQLIGEEPLNPADTVQNDDIVENQQILKVLIRKTGRFRVLVDGELVEDNIIEEGQRRAFTAKHQIEIRVPGAGSVSLNYNGRVIVPQGLQDKPRRLTFVDDTAQEPQ